MIVASIDGACRRNGRPDCTSAGGVFILHPTGETEVLSAYEYRSTNQRGELLALLKALDYIVAAEQEAQVVTDSEYIFNAMTKQWYDSWMKKGWVTSSGGEVKNKDIWLEIYKVMARAAEDIHFYHIKGHCISVGKVTASKLLDMDRTGTRLRHAATHKFDESLDKKRDVFNAAQELSEKNNGFKLPPDVFKLFVVINTVADAIATKVVEAADREM